VFIGSPSVLRAPAHRQRFHDLRHGAATLMLGAGVKEKVIQSILGHSTIVVTMDTYGHVIRDLHRDAAASMDKALRGTK
jgi:integrase